MSGPRRVVTDSVVVRVFRSSLSSKATTRWVAHLDACRYANDSMESMADLVARKGHDTVRTRIAVGVISPCKFCQPVLLTLPPEETQ